MAKSKEEFIKWVNHVLDQGYTITTDDDDDEVIATHHFYGTYLSNYTLDDLKKLSE